MLIQMDEEHLIISEVYDGGGGDLLARADMLITRIL
jgi:hypothetical protein